MELAAAIAVLEDFAGKDLTRTLSQIELSVQGTSVDTCSALLERHHARDDVLAAAGLVKRLAGQIHVVIHALGILICLPRILQPGETVEYVSLGAGNTGRAFDLETDRRIAEFKFIRWQGGPEVIRQNALFKDFFLLAEHDTAKEKNLYVLGTDYPLKFLNSRRSLESILSRHVALRARVGDQYPACETVRDYYLLRRDAVQVVDVSPFLPGLGDLADHVEPAV